MLAQGEEKVVPTEGDASSAKFQLRVETFFLHSALFLESTDAEIEKKEKDYSSSLYYLEDAKSCRLESTCCPFVLSLAKHHALIFLKGINSFFLPGITGKLM